MKSRQAGVEVWGCGSGGGRQSQRSVCKLKQLCCHRAQQLREPGEPSRPVTFPGADQHVWVRGNDHSLSDGWALMGHEERHRLPHLTVEERKHWGMWQNTSYIYQQRVFYSFTLLSLHVQTFAALTSLHAFMRPKPCWWLWWKPAPFTHQSALKSHCKNQNENH